MAVLPPIAKMQEELDPESEMVRILRDPNRADTWIETFLTIPDERGHIVPMKLYPQQRMMLKDQTYRDITVKGRQTRASSLILARNLRDMTTQFGLNQMVITEKDSTTAMFRARIHHHLRDLKRAGFDFTVPVDNDEELVIGELDNRYIWASAEQRVAGRGYAIQKVHGSEVAHWKVESAGEILGGILPSVPDPPYGMIDLESTPKGAEGTFYESVMNSRPLNATAITTTHFYPWWLEPRYNIDNWDTAGLPEHYRDLVNEMRRNFIPTSDEQNLMSGPGLSLGQILWRRLKMREMERTTTPFKQEFVEDLEGCFLSTADSFFASTDGIDHLAIHRQNILHPTRTLDRLPYRGTPVSFQGMNLHVWELPNASSVYAMYQDTSKGGTATDADPSVIIVMDAKAMRVVAKLVVKAAPRDVGEMGCAIGEFYMNAMYGGERDAWGQASLDRVKELGYRNIYYAADAGERKNPEAWIYPTPMARDRALQVFREKVFDHVFVCRDATLWLECGAFSWQKVNDHWKAKAAGKRTHDDHVLAAAGCCVVAERAQFMKPKPKGDRIIDLEVGSFGLVRRTGPNERKPWFR